MYRAAPHLARIGTIEPGSADGLAVLSHCREVAPQTFVLLMTAHATVETAVEALQRVTAGRPATGNRWPSGGGAAPMGT